MRHWRPRISPVTYLRFPDSHYALQSPNHWPPIESNNYFPRQSVQLPLSSGQEDVRPAAFHALQLLGSERRKPPRPAYTAYTAFRYILFSSHAFSFIEPLLTLLLL